MPLSWPVRHFIIGGWGGGVQTREGMERDDVTASRKALYGLSLLASASTHGDAEGFKEQLWFSLTNQAHFEVRHDDICQTKKCIFFTCANAHPLQARPHVTTTCSLCRLSFYKPLQVFMTISETHLLIDADTHTHTHTHTRVIYMCEAMCPIALLRLCNPLLLHVGLPYTKIFCSQRLSQRLAGCVRDFIRQDLKWCNKSMVVRVLSLCIYFILFFRIWIWKTQKK